MFRKILCPVDFDENALSALDTAIELAREHSGIVHLFHVVAAPMETIGQPLEFEPFRAAAEPTKQRLEEIAKERIGDRAQYDVIVVAGDPATEILREAGGPEVDVVVMATHGRTGLRRLVLGSVAERVVRESPRPVLTVRGATS